jgi:hypothetical protein
MFERRNAVARVGARPARRGRRWVVGVVAVLGAGGLAFGGLGVPVSASDLDTTGTMHASADVHGDCVTASAGTGPADESANPQDGYGFQATGDGTATATACRDGLGGTPPGDPGDVVPGTPDDVVPDDPAGAVNGVVTGVVDDVVPDDGDGFPPGDPGGQLPGADDVVPGDVVPGDPGTVLPGGGDAGDVTPGGLGGLVPAGDGLVPDVVDRLAHVGPPAAGGGSDGNDGRGSATNPPPAGTASGSADVGAATVDADADAEGGPLPASVLVGDPGGEPGVVDALTLPGGSLPRTGGGPGSAVFRLIVCLGLGRALLRLAIRRYPGAARA